MNKIHTHTSLFTGHSQLVRRLTCRTVCMCVWLPNSCLVVIPCTAFRWWEASTVHEYHWCPRRPSPSSPTPVPWSLYMGHLLLLCVRISSLQWLEISLHVPLFLEVLAHSPSLLVTSGAPIIQIYNQDGIHKKVLPLAPFFSIGASPHSYSSLL